MTNRSERIMRSARELVGVPFRLHGRSAQTGVDCIGLAVLALSRAGCASANNAPDQYAMRGGTLERFEQGMRAAGLRRVRNARPGDLVLVQAGVAQFHLMIALHDGYVHAHAGLGRVVEMPGPSLWPPVARWRWGR
jgi:cell wall-associated NlpC family hydrolase